MCQNEVIDECIECETCLKWSHAKCAKISREALKLVETTPGLHWYCEKCDKHGQSDSDRLNNLMSNMEARHSQIIDQAATKTQTLFDKLAVSSDNLLSNLSSKLENKFSEFKDQLTLITDKSKTSSDILDKTQENLKLSYAEITKSMQESSAALSNTLEARTNTIKECISTHTANIMREQKLAQVTQEKTLRAKNLIVFGMAEQDSLENAVHNLNCFLRHEYHINLELKTTALIRLGLVVQGKNRPIESP